MKTLRHKLISQLRQALHELEKPNNGDSVCFDILDTDFEFEEESLDAKEKEEQTNLHERHVKDPEEDWRHYGGKREAFKRK